jgi:hypothetical protein
MPSRGLRYRQDMPVLRPDVRIDGSRNLMTPRLASYFAPSPEGDRGTCGRSWPMLMRIGMYTTMTLAVISMAPLVLGVGTRDSACYDGRANAQGAVR